MTDRLQIASAILAGLLSYRSLNKSERDEALIESLRLADELINLDNLQPEKPKGW